MPPGSLNVDQIWQSLNTTTGKRGGISSLAGLPGIATQTRTLPRAGTENVRENNTDQPVKVEGPAIDELTSRLQLSPAVRDQFLVC